MTFEIKLKNAICVQYVTFADALLWWIHTWINIITPLWNITHLTVLNIVMFSVDAHLFWPPKTSFFPPFLARGMHSRWAPLNRCHCELETDGNEGSLQSGSPAAVLCTRCQGVMTAQQGGTQRYRRQHHLLLTSPPKNTQTHSHKCKGANRKGVSSNSRL